MQRSWGSGFTVTGWCRVMKGMKATELPPLVYQLLVLSVKGHRATVLNGIRTLFNHLDQEALDSQEAEEDEDRSVRKGGRKGGREGKEGKGGRKEGGRDNDILSSQCGKCEE